MSGARIIAKWVQVVVVVLAWLLLVPLIEVLRSSWRRVVEAIGVGRTGSGHGGRPTASASGNAHAATDSDAASRVRAA